MWAQKLLSLRSKVRFFSLCFTKLMREEETKTKLRTDANIYDFEMDF